MARIDRKPKDNTPLAVLCKILCNGVFNDVCGANETTYNAILVLLDLIDDKTAAQIRGQIEKRGERYKYKDQDYDI